jgi:hypothetical protein
MRASRTRNAPPPHDHEPVLLFLGIEGAGGEGRALHWGEALAQAIVTPLPWRTGAEGADAPGEGEEEKGEDAGAVEAHGRMSVGWCRSGARARQATVVRIPSRRAMGSWVTPKSALVVRKTDARGTPVPDWARVSWTAVAR